MLALYIFIVGGEVLFASGPIGQHGLHPHPYWLVILSMAAAHGTVAGLISAALAVALQVFGLTIDIGLTDALARIWDQGHNVLLFCGGAYLVGEIHDSHARRHFRLREDLLENTRESLRVAYERDALLVANQRLRKRIEEQPAHMADLLRSSASMNTPDLDALLPAMLDLVARNCGTSRASVWRVDEKGTIHLVEERGWHPAEREPREYSLQQSEFLRYVLHSGQPTQAFEYRGRLQPFDPILAAPLVDAEGVILALVLAEEIPANLLSPTAASVFFGIVEWGSHALEREQPVLEIDPPVFEGDPEDPDHVTEATAAPVTPVRPPRRVRTAGDLEARLRIEFARCARYGARMSLIGLMVEGWVTDSESAQRELDSVLAEAMSPGLVDDEIYRSAQPGVYVMVLSGDQADETITHAIAHAASHVDGLPIRARVFGVDVSVPDVGSLATRFAGWMKENGAGDGSPFAAVEIDRAGHLEDLLVRLRLEQRIAMEQEHELPLVLFRAPNHATEEELVRAATAARRVLRPTDGVYVFEPNTVALLLPRTSDEDVKLVIDRFLAGWHAAGDVVSLSTSEPQILPCHEERLAPLGVLTALGGRA